MNQVSPVSNGRTDELRDRGNKRTHRHPSCRKASLLIREKNFFFVLIRRICHNKSFLSSKNLKDL